MNLSRIIPAMALLMLATITSGVLADENRIRELRLELRDKAVACARAGNQSCAQTCENAMRSVAAGEDVQRAVAECERAHSGVAADRQAAEEGRVLQAGYQWMPDVVATIRAVSRGRLSNPFLVTGRDNDWGRYCTSVRYLSGGGGGRLVTQPGTRVILKNVQYTTEPKRSGRCVVGRIEAYGDE